MHLADHVPIWLVLVIFVGVAFACVECGFRLGRHRRRSGAHEPTSAVGAMVGSTLALLAFVLGFTFNLAATKFEERRTVVLAEANAIGTTYLRADFLEEPAKTRVKRLLREYLALRTIQESQSIPQTIAKSESLQDALWLEAVSAANKHPTPIAGLFASALNEMIDIHAKRITAGIYTRVPIIVWLCLLIITALSMTGIGLLCGFEERRSIYGTSILITAFGLVMLLVSDLDRPLQGVIRTPQQPLLDLQKKLGPP